MKDEFVAVVGGKLCFQRHVGKEPAIVFLHGGGGSLSSWAVMAPELKKLPNEQIFVDLRGHGRSVRTDKSQDYQLEKHAADLAKLLEVLKLKSVYLVGHCLGAMVAATFAVIYPAKVKKLVLINPGERGESFLFSAVTQKLTVVVSALFSWLKNPLPIVRADYQPFQGTSDLSPHRLFVDIKHTGLKAYLLQGQAFLEWQGEQYFDKIGAPTLIIAGKKDLIFPPAVSRRINHLVKNSQLEFINTNHVSVFNQPQSVFKACRNFLFGDYSDTERRKISAKTA